MIYTTEQHIDDLLRHLGLVREACCLLGGRLMDRGETDFGRLLIARGHIHDASKFHGIEWDYLHVGDSVNEGMLKLAIKQHTTTNSHHPEYHGGIHNMPKLDIAEMVCDCYARGQEHGTNIREWFTKSAVQKYNIDLESKQWTSIQQYLDLLLQTGFKK